MTADEAAAVATAPVIAIHSHNYIVSNITLYVVVSRAEGSKS
jgi:hypothetical protein